MLSVDKIAQRNIRRLARRGKLVDECFKIFQIAVYPGAPPDQVRQMRICFFAGAAETFALLQAGLDEGVEGTEGDLELMNQWVEELRRFHERTIATATASPEGTAQ